MSRYILGIDPGLSGALAVVDSTSQQLVDVFRMPVNVVKKQNKLNGDALAGWFRFLDLITATDHFAYVEDVHSRPRQAGQFQFGLNTGIIHGLLYGHEIPFALVSPMAWKSFYGIKRVNDETKADKKTEAREIATRLFPTFAHEFKRVRDDGVAEAALIALYGANLQGEGT